MFPLVWSGCGQDTVMLLEARLTWCMAGTAEGTGVGVTLVGFPGAGEQEWGTGAVLRRRLETQGRPRLTCVAGAYIDGCSLGRVGAEL